MRVIGFTIAALAILLTVAVASAQIPVRCYPMEMALAAIEKQHGETPAFVFSNRHEETFIITVNPDTGSWSSSKQTSDGMLCPISSGDNFGPAPDAFKARAIPGEDS